MRNPSKTLFCRVLFLATEKRDFDDFTNLVQPRKLSETGLRFSPQDWLDSIIKVEDDATCKPLDLPTYMDPTTGEAQEYNLKMLQPDQAAVAVEVLATIKEWMECADLSTFQPLRMTVNGGGGSGKSVLINTIVTVLRKIFDTNEVVYVAAPTGTAAFNVGGETFHHLTTTSVGKGEYQAKSMSKEKKLRLIKRFRVSLALLIDERSLINSKDLGTTAHKISETLYEGGRAHDFDFGGLPVVILFGDDHQLPGTGEGALDALSHPNKNTPMIVRGRDIFLRCAERTMELSGNKRLNARQSFNARLIQDVRKNIELSEKQLDKLMNLHMLNVQQKMGPETVKEINDNAIFLFFSNEKVNRKNTEQLAQHCNEYRPVAICKAQGTGVAMAKAVTWHYGDDAPSASWISEGAKVALNHRNFNPLWGLHNGACGIVKEIVFRKGHNPNHGDLPLYVVVHFPLYCGPVWDTEDPKVSYRNNGGLLSKRVLMSFKSVPIPVCEYRCNRSYGSTCCKRTYVPLTLAWARTIHKFQGMSAGPVQDNQIPNMYKYVICDPDKGCKEGTALGLFYTALSRGTTLGDFDGKGSAIYFAGPDFTKERVRSIGKMNKSHNDFTRIRKRKRWVSYLDSRVYLPKRSQREIRDIIRWANLAVITYNDLYARTRRYVEQGWRS